VRSIARRVLPAKLRRVLRIALRELPHRLRDFPQDLRESLRRAPDSLPPARLRHHVGLTSSRAEFRTVGEQAVADVLRAYGAVRPEEGYGRWLDYGCGSGRILLQLRRAGVAELWGVDPDRAAIRWLRRRYGAERFAELPPAFPLAFPAGSFDVVLAISIFTHLDEAPQLAALAEIARLLRPGGLLIASTHGRELLATRGDLTADQVQQLDTTGFLFAAGGGPFNESSTFHSAGYLEKTWGRWFERQLSLAKGLMNYQDLSVWQAHPLSSRSPPPSASTAADRPAER
jgi:SAM-dependent methyltransferase